LDHYPEVYRALVGDKGFSQNLMDASQQKGNIIFIQNMIGGMKIQPCGPTYPSS
jgi:hypothetical protein